MTKSLTKPPSKNHTLHSKVKRSKRQHGQGQDQDQVISLNDVQLEEASQNQQDKLQTIVNSVNEKLETLKAKREQIKNNINNLPESVKKSFLDRFTQNIRPAIGGLLSKQNSASSVQINNIKKKSYNSVNTDIKQFIDQTLVPFEAEIAKAAQAAVQPAAAKQSNAAAQSNASKSPSSWFKNPFAKTPSTPRQKEMKIVINWNGEKKELTIREDIECKTITKFLQANKTVAFIYKMNEKEEAKAKTNATLTKGAKYIAIVCYLNKDGKQMNIPMTEEMLKVDNFDIIMKDKNPAIQTIISTLPSPPQTGGKRHRISRNKTAKKNKRQPRRNRTHRK